MSSAAMTPIRSNPPKSETSPMIERSGALTTSSVEYDAVYVPGGANDFGFGETEVQELGQGRDLVELARLGVGELLGVDQAPAA